MLFTCPAANRVPDPQTFCSGEHRVYEEGEDLWEMELHRLMIPLLLFPPSLRNEHAHGQQLFIWVTDKSPPPATPPGKDHEGKVAHIPAHLF